MQIVVVEVAVAADCLAAAVAVRVVAAVVVAAAAVGDGNVVEGEAVAGVGRADQEGVLVLAAKIKFNYVSLVISSNNSILIHSIVCGVWTKQVQHGTLHTGRRFCKF